MNKSVRNVLLGLLTVAVILFFVVDMPHLLRSARSAARSSAARSILINLANANSFYVSDHDGRFPAASSMPTLRALLQPYEESVFSQKMHYSSGDSRKLNWRPQKNFWDPSFNFNLASVSYDDALKPIGFGTVESSEIVVFFITDSELNRITGVDLANRHIRYSESLKLKEEDFYRHISYQFDRKGAKLFPPDYLADQDPLKEIR